MFVNFIRIRCHAFFRNDNRMHRFAPFVVANNAFAEKPRVSAWASSK